MDSVYVITHINNFKIIYSNRQTIDSVKKQFMEHFPIKNMDPISFYLSTKGTRDREKRTIILTYIQTIERIL